MWRCGYYGQGIRIRPRCGGSFKVEDPLKLVRKTCQSISDDGTSRRPPGISQRDDSIAAATCSPSQRANMQSLDGSDVVRNTVWQDEIEIQLLPPNPV